MLGNLTGDPNAYWLEKMLSGRYFGPLATGLLRLAGESGLFSSGLHRRLMELGDISTRDAHNYLHNPSDRKNALCAAVKDSGAAGDALRVWYLIDALLERAARLTASNLAASVLKGQTADGPIHPVCMSIDGTTFFRYYRFRYRVEGYLRPFLASRDKYYEMVQVDDAPLIGATVAALTN
jgi:hexokinase